MIEKGGVMVLVELVSDEEDEELSNKAYQVSEKSKVNIVIVLGDTRASCCL
jgi:hypothetical protein